MTTIRNDLVTYLVALLVFISVYGLYQGYELRKETAQNYASSTALTIQATNAGIQYTVSAANFLASSTKR